MTFIFINVNIAKFEYEAVSYLIIQCIYKINLNHNDRAEVYNVNFKDIYNMNDIYK